MERLSLCLVLIASFIVRGSCEELEEDVYDNFYDDGTDVATTNKPNYPPIQAPSRGGFSMGIVVAVLLIGLAVFVYRRRKASRIAAANAESNVGDQSILSLPVAVIKDPMQSSTYKLDKIEYPIAMAAIPASSATRESIELAVI